MSGEINEDNDFGQPGKHEEQEDYKLVVLQAGEVDGDKAFRAVAAAWNLKTGTSRAFQPGEVAADFDDYINEVRTDMQSLWQGTTIELMEKRQSGETASQNYMDVMTSLTDLPVEVVHNMMANMLLASVDELSDK
jgi:hypothetical protein